MRFQRAATKPSSAPGREFNNQPANVRSANRNRNAPSNRNTSNGFRPASTWQQDVNSVPPEFESLDSLEACGQVQVVVPCRVTSVGRTNEAQARRVGRSSGSNVPPGTYSTAATFMIPWSAKIGWSINYWSGAER
jgi:hypothetical protein